MKYPYPIKDWKNPDDYKNIDSFAWEFLRRNADYQRDFDKGVSIGRLDGMAGLIKMTRAYGIADPVIAEDPRYDCAKVVFETGYEKIEADYYDEDLRLALNEIGLGEPLKPENNYEVVIKFNVYDKRLLRKQIKDAENELLLAWNSNHRCATGFRCGVDTTGQARKQSNDLLLIYLRVLDAMAGGVEKSEIASVLLSDVSNKYPDYLASKRLKNYINKAESNAKSGYRVLAALELSGG